MSTQLVVVALVAVISGGAWLRTASAVSQWLVYEDPQRRFTFTYPSSFGSPSRGTNDGYGERVAAIRFARFSTEGVGGELVVTRGLPTLDLQAAGGLLDSITREALPERWRRTVIAALPRLTASTLCHAIAAPTHLDLAAPALAPIPGPQRAGLENLDRLGNVDPVVDACEARNGVTVFHKSARLAPGGPRRSIAGGIRFVDGDYSSVQIVRGVAPASAEVLQEMRQILESWRPGTQQD